MADIKKIHIRKTDVTYDIKDEVARQQVATKQDAISNVSVDYQEDGGNPDASAQFENGTLAFSMKNMKMKFSELTEEEKAQLKGDKGDQGDSVIVGEGDLPLANVIGDDTDKAITPKAVKDAVTIADPLDFFSADLEKYPCALAGSKKWNTKTNTEHAVIPCVEGDVFKIECLGSAKTESGCYGFLASHNYSAGALVDYADVDRVWVNEGTSVTVTAPQGSTFLCLSTIDDNIGVVLWKVTKFVNKLPSEYVAENSEFSTGERLKDVGISHQLEDSENTIPTSALLNDSLNNLYTKDYYSVDLVKYPFALGATKKWNRFTESSHAVIPCVEGDTFRIECLDAVAETKGCYGFLASNTYSNYGDVDYANGTDRVWVSEGSYVIATAPQGTAFLCMSTVDNNKAAVTWKISKIGVGEVKKAIDEVKEGLKELSVFLPNVEDNHYYYGERINLNTVFSWSKYANNAYKGQSSAIYGDYLFILNDKLVNVACYNMRTQQLLYTLATGFSNAAIWHCNSASFSTLRYDQDDVFPVLYTSVKNDANGRCAWVAYRIIPTYTDDEISSFTIEQVQVIHLPVMTDENCLGETNVCVDAQNEVLWGFGHNSRAGADNRGIGMFTQFPMPPLSETEVTWEDSDIVQSFSIGSPIGAFQDGFIHNGKLYFARGYESAGHISLQVVDLYARKMQVTFVDLLANGFTEEPEGLFLYNGKIYTSSLNTNIWEFKFA